MVTKGALDYAAGGVYATNVGKTNGRTHSNNRFKIIINKTMFKIVPVGLLGDNISI
jgi:hypothetical protein